MQDSYPYIELQVPRDKEEALLNCLYPLGFERFAYKRDADDYNVITDGQPYMLIECFLSGRFIEEKQKEEMARLFNDLGIISDFTIMEKKTQDWGRLFRESFVKTELAGNIYVVPDWDESDQGPDTIKIEPGMGFGTGQHFTTRSICFLITQDDYLNDRFVFDLGSGSSLLSLFACRMKAQSLVAMERDSSSVINARKNILLNGLQDSIFLIKADILRLPAKIRHIYKYFMNIDYSIVSEFLFRHLDEMPLNSKLLVSGIQNSEKQEFEKQVLDFALKIRTSASNGEWLAFCIEKR